MEQYVLNERANTQYFIRMQPMTGRQTPPRTQRTIKSLPKNENQPNEKLIKKTIDVGIIISPYLY